MSPAQPQGPFCQSCSMPLEKPEDFGTDATGFRVNDYCHWCYWNGAFTAPEMSMQEMIDKCITVMVEKRIMPAPDARQLMTTVIPKLKRWRAVPVGA